MRAVSEHDERFGRGLHGRRGVQHPVTKLFAQRCIARFKGEERIVRSRHSTGLRALPTDVNPLEGEKDASGHSSPSRCTLWSIAALACAPWATAARLVAPSVFLVAFFV